MPRKKVSEVAEATETKDVDKTAAEVTAEVEEVQTTTTAVPAENHIKRIYAGATVPGMKANTVFTGDIPDVLNKPFLRELCIPVEEYPNFIKNKAVTSSREAYCYRKSVETAKELKK